MTRSLAQAIEENRKRQRTKPTMQKPREVLRPYSVDVLIVPPNSEIVLGLATIHRERRTIYGTSKKDAMERAGIQ